MMKLERPVGPWYINVVHMYFYGRPWCCAAVDHRHAEYSEDWDKVNCLWCHNERKSFDEEMARLHREWDKHYE